jgi:NADPH:quinone reductase-like Zn-dependent oxidoreductase
VKAAVYRSYGPPEVVRITDVERPVPKDNEILIRVRATTVCAADWRLRSANPFVARFVVGLLRPRRLMIGGMELAGVVESVGKSVTRFRAGDEVFGGARTFGGHAEYVCLAEGSMALKPVNMTFDEAAAVVFGGFSALSFFRRAKIRAGQDVLIYGASGSVGVFAVQLAKHFGARVTGVCSTANLDLVKSLGADHVIDYTREDFSKSGQEYDIVFDTVGKSGTARSLRVLKRGGAYVQIAPTSASDTLALVWAWVRGVRIVWGVASGSADDLRFLKQLIEEGKLKTVIDRRYPLDEIVAAHRHAEAGHKKGHVVIVVA